MEDSKVKGAMHAAYTLALLAIAVVPASADLYSNGPMDGGIYAWIIQSPQTVSDAFVLSSTSTVTGVDFGAWTMPGDSVTSVQWSIGTTPGDNSLGGGVATTTDTFVMIETAFGMYWVDSDGFSTGNINLSAGTYYLTLGNATTLQDGFAAWDLNNGPSAGFFSEDGVNYSSLANQYDTGTNSDAFGIQGTTTPEPGYWVLLSVALVGLIWVKRGRAGVQA
jgi:hypothetical protein